MSKCGAAEAEDASSSGTAPPPPGLRPSAAGASAAGWVRPPRAAPGQLGPAPPWLGCPLQPAAAAEDSRHHGAGKDGQTRYLQSGSGGTPLPPAAVRAAATAAWRRCWAEPLTPCRGHSRRHRSRAGRGGSKGGSSRLQRRVLPGGWEAGGGSAWRGGNKVVVVAANSGCQACIQDPGLWTSTTWHHHCRGQERAPATPPLNSPWSPNVLCNLLAAPPGRAAARARVHCW